MPSRWVSLGKFDDWCGQATNSRPAHSRSLQILSILMEVELIILLQHSQYALDLARPCIGLMCNAADLLGSCLMKFFGRMSSWTSLLGKLPV